MGAPIRRRGPEAETILLWVLIGAVINLLGAALQSGAQNLAMILVGRILAGWAVGILSMSVPIYQSECAHPSKRGTSVLSLFLSLQILPLRLCTKSWENG